MVDPVRLLALADSDSYLKWAGSTLDQVCAALPDAQPQVMLVRSPLLPTAEQRTAALDRVSWLTGSEPIPVVGPAAIRARLAALSPDVVLVACTGPLAELLIRTIRTLPRRPAVVSGLPGIALPATEAGLHHRAGADALIVHSRRERQAYAALACRLGVVLPTILARLPFLSAQRPHESHRQVNRVVFAAQSLFPATFSERTEVLHALGRLALERPDVRVVIKLRAQDGERQTHDEPYPYERLWASYRTMAGFGADALSFGRGAMTSWLTPGAALVTVSSTAAVEAIGLGLPTAVLNDFGVSDELLNGAFVGSGLLATLADVAGNRFGTARPEWLADNWFHPEASQLPEAVVKLARRSRAGLLPTGDASGRSARTWLRSTLPVGVSRLVWAARRTT